MMPMIQKSSLNANTPASPRTQGGLGGVVDGGDEGRRATDDPPEHDGQLWERPHSHDGLELA